MNDTRLRTTTCLLLLAFLAAAPALAQSKGRLVGKIVDPDGKPIQGVTVTATSPQIPGFKRIETTDRKGVFTIDFNKIDVTYVYQFDKTGYQTLEAQQQWGLEGSQFFDWTMHPAVPGAPDSPFVSSTSAPAVEAYNAGLAAFKAKDYPAAEARFSEAVSHDPNLRTAWEALSSVQLELRQYEAAASAAEKAMSLGSTEEAVLMARWQAYKNLKNDAKIAEALDDLERFGRRAEEAKRVHNEAVALVKAGDHAGAFAKFQEAVNLDRNLQVSLLGLANAGLKIGRNIEAAAAAESILKADPKNEQAVRLRFNAVLALNDSPRLIDALAGLAPYEPTTARDGILRLAFEAYDANQLALAEERFLKALEIDPNYPQAYYYLGVIDTSQGAMADARKHLERFLKLAPNDPEADSAREMLRYLKNN
jgi:Tfp pilus assembly protein PilF